jgi:hypothetical protein
MPSTKTGGDVDAFCSKCQLELAHVVVAVVTGRPAKVQCKTCGTVHAYRGGSNSSGAKKKRPAAGSARVAGSRSRGGAKRNDYDDLMKGRDLSRAQRYKPATIFSEGAVISHPIFGVGIVTRALSDGKIEVLFQAGSKVLVHSRGA